MVERRLRLMLTFVSDSSQLEERMGLVDLVLDGLLAANGWDPASFLR